MAFIEKLSLNTGQNTLHRHLWDIMEWPLNTGGYYKHRFHRIALNLNRHVSVVYICVLPQAGFDPTSEPSTPQPESRSLSRVIIPLLEQVSQYTTKGGGCNTGLFILYAVWNRPG